MTSRSFSGCVRVALSFVFVFVCDRATVRAEWERRSPTGGPGNAGSPRLRMQKLPEAGGGAPGAWLSRQPKLPVTEVSGRSNSSRSTQALQYGAPAKGVDNGVVQKVQARLCDLPFRRRC
jgi:hypothetical protein